MDELNETMTNDVVEAVEAINDIPAKGIGGWAVGGACLLGGLVIGAIAGLKKTGKLDELKAKCNAKKIEKLEKQLEDRKNRYTVIEDVKSEEDDK